MFAFLLKIQLAGTGVGVFPGFVSLTTDAELKDVAEVCCRGVVAYIVINTNRTKLFRS